MPDTSNHPRWLLRRTDQALAAAGVAAALALAIGWWFLQGGWSNRLIEIDEAQPLEARFEVDVNTAGCPELMQLPDIGPTLAHRIVESRETEGPFSSVDDLRRVRGIGPKKLEHIRPYVRIAPDDRGKASRSRSQ